MTFDAAKLQTMLDGESAAVGSFIDLLRREQECLVRGDTDGVAAFIEPKSRCALELAGYADRRTSLLRSLGYGSDRAGMTRLLRERTGTASPALTAWQNLLKLAQTARLLNETNGKLIDSRLQVTQRALGALFSAARLPGAYAADGSTVSMRTAQQLAVA